MLFRSKSRGNLVRLSDELADHGVDAIRLTMVFAGPPEDDIDWAEVSPSGARKFLARAWRLSGDVDSPVGVDPSTGAVVVKVSDDKTGEIVRQIPSEEALRVARNIEALTGILVDQRE